MSLKKARGKLGLTQGKAADLLGVPLRTYQNWEQGHRSAPSWARKMILEKMDGAEIEMIIKMRHNKDFEVPEYNCGLGWRGSLLGAMEEAGYGVEMQTMTSFLTSASIVRGKDEWEAKKIAETIEKFFNVLEVPKELNSGHYLTISEAKKKYEGKIHSYLASR